MLGAAERGWVVLGVCKVHHRSDLLVVRLALARRPDALARQHLRPGVPVTYCPKVKEMGDKKPRLVVQTEVEELLQAGDQMITTWRCAFHRSRSGRDDWAPRQMSVAFASPFPVSAAFAGGHAQ